MSEVRPNTASFVVRALRNGSIVTVRWSCGAFEGDPPTIDLVEMEAEMIATSQADVHLGFATGGDAETLSEESVSDPVGAFALIQRVVDRILEVSVDPVEGPT